MIRGEAAQPASPLHVMNSRESSRLPLPPAHAHVDDASRHGSRLISYDIDIVAPCLPNVKPFHKLLTACRGRPHPPAASDQSRAGTGQLVQRAAGHHAAMLPQPGDALQVLPLGLGDGIHPHHAARALDRPLEAGVGAVQVHRLGVAEHQQHRVRRQHRGTGRQHRVQRAAHVGPLPPDAGGAHIAAEQVHVLQREGVHPLHLLGEQEYLRMVGDLRQRLHEAYGEFRELQHRAGHVAEHHDALAAAVALLVMQPAQRPAGAQPRADRAPEVQRHGAARVLAAGDDLAVDAPGHLVDELVGPGDLGVLEVGDVLFSGTGTIGRTALVKEKPTNWNIKEGVYALKPFKEVINSCYLIQLLHSNHIKDKISILIVGDPIKSVPMKNLVTVSIPVPSIQEQQRIVSILDTFEASIQNLEAQLSQREKQYEYYRNKLLTFD